MNRPRTDNSYSGEFSEQIAVGREPVSPTSDPQHAAISAVADPQCLVCGSWAVYPLGHASSTETRAAMSPQRVASPPLPFWLAVSQPPEKMTTWTGVTLALLLWPPCIFLLLQMLDAQPINGRFVQESLGLYLVALGVGLIAWAGPARQAHHYHSSAWEEEIREWHAARVCLACGSRLASWIE